MVPNIVTRMAALLAARASFEATAPSLGLPKELQQSWAQYSPWFPEATYVSPPSGCQVAQVNLLQRHGARYPTTNTGKHMQSSLAKLQKATAFNDPKLAFVKEYKYTLGTEDLIPFGAEQSFDAGQEHFVRYADLVDCEMLPFVRAAGSDRVINSARNWTAGFAHASEQEYVPVVSVIIPETESSNNTLDTGGCPNAGSSSSATSAWVDVFTPAIAKRINAAAPGANLSNTDIVYLMALCPFDTVFNEAPSQWCNVFTSEEWASYEYYGDLNFYYGTGYGQQLGPVQGVGYVNELLARLTGQPVQDETKTNHTLDDSPDTFPLDRAFYADFTHDTEITAIISAMGLFQQDDDLDPKQPDDERTWVVSHIVPFSGRMITEKLTCDGSGIEAQGDYVRVLVNDAVQPLAFCDASDDGLCGLEEFVQSQHYARNNGEGDWALCFAGNGA